MPACPRAPKRGLSLKGSPCPPKSLYSPCTSSQDVGGLLAGENRHIYWVPTHQCCLLCAGCSLLAYCRIRAPTLRTTTTSQAEDFYKLTGTD